MAPLIGATDGTPDAPGPPTNCANKRAIQIDAVDRGIAIVDKNHGYKRTAIEKSSSITQSRTRGTQQADSAAL
ncbi:hypothetical protein [Cupriavidus neocaledonicus]|uniref:hypothetical protein n=1 Tax=Cupriavidus neocaledonicus TaxID=1040979 RepID=UPI0011AEBC84|nr:hypothetical protein [Cupriavidus neocaledonicus]